MEINFEEISNTKLEDTATGGTCFSCFLTVEQYYNMLKDVYETSNEFQRELIDLRRNKVYAKLVKDLAKGVVIPTISLYFENCNKIETKIDIDNTNIRILDGLQRTNCIFYAYNVLNGTKVDNDIFKNIDTVSFEDFRNKIIRVEIWINLTVNGILYKMVSLNAGQTPMRIEHQFEVLELPLMNELKTKGVVLYRQSSYPREKYQFYLSSVVEGAIAYNLETSFPKKQESAISFLDQMEIFKDQHESIILKSEIFIEDLVWVIKDFHLAQISAYNTQDLLEFRGILADQDAFFIPFMAALGKARHDLKDKLDPKMVNLVELLSHKGEDSLNLLQYRDVTNTYRTGIGQRKRKLVFTAFNLYFLGMEIQINWKYANELANL